MRTKKWKRIVLWTLGIVMLLGTGGVIAANYAVNRVMDSFVAGLDLESDPVTDSSLSGNPAPASSGTAPATAPATAPGAADPATTGQSEKSSSPGSSTNAEKSGTSANGSKASDEAGAKPSSEGSTAKPEGPGGDVSIDKAKEVRGSLTVSDKATAASILMTSLSASDIERLRELAKGGLTVEEKRTAKSILLNKLSESDYDTLSGLAKKYGVSKGRTYAEAKEEIDSGK